MDTARQVLRWTIPGWVLLVLLFLYDAVGMAFGAPSTLWQAVWADARLLVGFAAAGLPIGFIVYQIYFWVYWTFPFPVVLGLGNPLDRAQSILIDVQGDMRFPDSVGVRWKEVPDTATKKKKVLFLTIPYKSREIMMDYRDNWFLANFAWHRMVVENEVEPLERVALGYSDIYHSLGAGRWSLVLAWVAYVGLGVSNHHARLGSLIVSLLITIVLFRAFTAARYDTLATLLRFKHDFLTYYHRHPRKGAMGKE